MNEATEKKYELKKRLNLAIQNGNVEEIINNSDMVLALEPYDREALFAKAYVLAMPNERHCDYDRALRLIKNGLEHDAKSAQRWVDLGIILDFAGEHGFAILSHRKSLELQPKNYDALTKLSVYYVTHPLYVPVQEAKQLLMRAVEAEPDKWEAYHLLFYLNLKALKNRNEALQFLKCALDRIGTSNPHMRSQMETELAKLLEDDSL